MSYEEEDFDEYIPPIPRMMPNAAEMRRQGITASKLMEGVEFECKEEDITASEKRELEELAEDDSKGVWWTKDELMHHIEMGQPELADILDDDGLTDFDELKKKMQVLYTDPDGKPLVWKQLSKPGVGEPINQNMTIQYHATGYFEGADEPFDCSQIRKVPYTSKLNYDPVLKGLLVGILTMRKFEKARFLIAPEMAFGALGCPPRIPPEATLLYCVQILKTYDESELINLDVLTYEEQQAIPFEELMKAVDKERISGNTYFTDKRFKEARQRYHRAITILEERMLASAEQEEQQKAILLKLYRNSAITLNEIGKHHAAIHHCKKALNIDPNDTKVHFQYGKACTQVGYYDKAKHHLLQARKAKPNDAKIAQALQKLNNRISDANEENKALYARMGGIYK